MIFASKGEREGRRKKEMHNFCNNYYPSCRECLRGSVVNSIEPEIKCPFDDGKYICGAVISEREIRTVSMCNTW